MIETCGCDYDGEYAVIYEITRVKRSKRDRKCWECGCELPAGGPYARHSSLYDGSWSHSSVCVSCEDWAERLIDTGVLDCRPPVAELWAYIGVKPDEVPDGSNLRDQVGNLHG